MEGKPAFLTLEPAVTNPVHACIPEGSYFCHRVKDRTTMGGLFIPETFEVTGVPDRSGILFHVGNFAKDTLGCICLGLMILNSQAIGDSRDAFSEFLSQTATMDTFKLFVGHA